MALFCLQLGRFALSADGLVKLINCEGIENTATHSGTTPKGELSLEWQAPTEFNGDVQFHATVAQTYNNFWVGILSEPVRVHPRNAPLPSSPGISTTRAPIQSTVPTFLPDTQRPVSIRISLTCYLIFLLYMIHFCIAFVI